jgi:hypothetical protein
MKLEVTPRSEAGTGSQRRGPEIRVRFERGADARAHASARSWRRSSTDNVAESRASFRTCPVLVERISYPAREIGDRSTHEEYALLEPHV